MLSYFFKKDMTSSDATSKVKELMRSKELLSP